MDKSNQEKLENMTYDHYVNQDEIFEKGSIHAGEAQKYMEEKKNSIEQAVGESIRHIPGLLALKSGPGDLFKTDGDLSRGISATETDTGVRVKIKVIAEASYDPSSLIREMTDSITLALKDRLGLETDKLEVEIADTMTPEEFQEHCKAERALH